MDGFKDSTKMKYMTYNPNATIGDQLLGTAGSKIADRGLKGVGLLRAQKLDPNATVIERPMISGMNKGGAAMKSVDKDKNPGLSKLPTDVRNKMGYMKKGGVMKKGNGGGVFNEKGKRATMAEIAAEDRRMAGRPVEGVSTRPTDSSGRRASDADLGRPAVKKVVKKAMGGGMDAKLSKAIENAKAAMTAAPPRAKPTIADFARNNSQVKPSSGNPLMGGMNRGDIVASKHRGPSMAPAFNDRPMIRRKTGGLSVMPKGKC